MLHHTIVEGRKHSRLVIVNKRRFTLFLLVCTALLALVGWFLFQPKAIAHDGAYVVYRVARGDTLWDISKAYAPEGMDCRKYLYELRSLNDLSHVDLSIGQELRLPVWNQ